MKFPLFGHATTDHGDQIRGLLAQAESLEGPEKIPLLRRAVALADDSHDEALPRMKGNSQRNRERCPRPARSIASLTSAPIKCALG